MAAKSINGTLVWDDVLEQEDQERIRSMVDNGEDLIGYTITGGKYAGVVIGRTLKVPLAAWAVLKGKKSIIKNPLKRKADPDVCNCVALAKKYTAGPGDCNTFSGCKNKFEAAFAADIQSLYKTEKKIAEDYYNDCYGKHAKIMFSADKRENSEFKLQCKTFKTMLDDQNAVTAELAALLGKFFRIKNQNKNKKSGERSVADKIIPFEKIEIKFKSPPAPLTFADAAAPFDHCATNAETLQSSMKFTVMSASPLNKGKTVELSRGSKYCLMTFDNAVRNQANGGTVTWIDPTSKEAKCANVKWKGQIIKLIS